MFIVQKNEASNKTIRMPNALIEQLEELAASEDISFNQLVVQCCEYALANLPKSNGKITCTEQFLKNKKQYRTAFITYMSEHSKASAESLSQLFTDAIFSTKQYNSEFYMTGYIDDTSDLKLYDFKTYNSDYHYKVDKYDIETVKLIYTNVFSLISECDRRPCCLFVK